MIRFLYSNISLDFCCSSSYFIFLSRHKTLSSSCLHRPCVSSNCLNFVSNSRNDRSLLTCLSSSCLNFNSTMDVPRRLYSCLSESCLIFASRAILFYSHFPLCSCLTESYSNWCSKALNLSCNCLPFSIFVFSNYRTFCEKTMYLSSISLFLFSSRFILSYCSCLARYSLSTFNAVLCISPISTWLSFKLNAFSVFFFAAPVV